MSEPDGKPDVIPPRLCSEIQLFDLCDLDSCGHKNSRFCTDSELLFKFEKIADDELRAPQRYFSEEGEDEESDGYINPDDENYAFESDGFDTADEGGREDEE